MDLKELEFYENWIGLEKEVVLKFGNMNQSQIELEFDKTKYFFGLSHKKIQISTDTSNKISLVSLVFAPLLNKQTFNAFVEYYGSPNLFKEDTLISKSDSKIETKTELGFHQNLSKKEFSTKLVKFEENPTWIVWQKKNYELIIRQDYNYNAVHVIFKNRNF